MSDFDPFTATLEEAMAQPGDTLAVSRWGAAQRLLAGQKRFESDPLAGVYLCAQHGLRMPDWLADAFTRAYDRVQRAEVRSWDEAFGRMYPKGTQLARLRLHRRKAQLIFRAVIDAKLRNPDVALDDELFEEIGRKHAVGKTLAQELYKEVAQHLGYSAGKIKRSLKRSAAQSQPATSPKLTGTKKRL